MTKEVDATCMRSRTARSTAVGAVAGAGKEGANKERKAMGGGERANKERRARGGEEGAKTRSKENPNKETDQESKK